MSVDLSGADFDFLCSSLRRGNVVLFCGAGFSADAKNQAGNIPPLGNGLASNLADLASLPYDGEPLPIVYQAVRHRVGNQILFDRLRELYFIHEWASWYSNVTCLVWHRVYTLNIDNLVQQLYATSATQSQETIICPSIVRDRDPHFGKLQCVHLHGSVTDLDKGVTFTLDDFAHQQTTTNPWYDELVDDLYNRPVVFVGSLMEESPFQHYIALRGRKQHGTKEYRPKSYLVSRTIGPIRSEALKEQNIVPIEGTADEFFAALKARLNHDPITLTSVRRQAFPHIFETTSQTSESIIRHFDPIFAENLPSSPRFIPHSFYLGAEPTWRDIDEGRDGERDATDTLVDELARHGDDFHCTVLYGPAGCGKSTIMKRTALEFAKEGKVVYVAKGEQLIDLTGITELATNADSGNGRIYVFIDGLARQLVAIHRVKDRLLKASRLSLILAERTNVYASREHALADFQPATIAVRDLTEREIESILDRLETFNYLGELLGKSHEERVAEFKHKASRQLLVAMKETTSGMGFNAILEDEYRQLVPGAKLAYTICCLVVAQGAPGVYRKNLLPALGKTDFAKGALISELLRGVLVSANDSGTLLRPRHRIIATEVARNIAPLGAKVEAIELFLKQIAPEINRYTARSRAPAFVAYRSLINSHALFDLLGGDPEIILNLYEELRTYYSNQFLFWLHYGMAHISCGELDVAENYLNQAEIICDEQNANPFQIRHQRGILYLLQACRANPATTGKDRAAEGINLLKALIQERGDSDAYPFHAYMDHVTKWYVHAGNLISNAEWDDLKSTAQLAATKYRMDDMIRDARDAVERAYLLRLTVDADENDGSAGTE